VIEPIINAILHSIGTSYH